VSVPALADAEIAPSPLPRLKPRDRQVAELHWEGLNNRQIAKQLTRRPETVGLILKKPEVLAWLSVMDQRAQLRMAEKRIGARAILKASEEEFARVLVEGVREAKRPMDKVLAGEKALGLVGVVAPKEIHQTVEHRLAALSDDELAAWANEGRVPPALVAEYAVLPEVDDG
jgi:IS30 family transposase